MTSALSIKLGLTGLAQVQAGLRGLSNDVSRGFASLRGFALSATAALAGFAGVAGVGAAVRAGVGFNSQLENLRISLAATMKQLRPDAFKTWDAALTTSGAVVDLLHAKARDLRVDFEDVAKAFQAFTADATRAGVGLEDQVTLITTLAQATSALGLKGDALATEARGLLGGAEMRAALTTKLLGVTKAELQDARERGEIFDFLMGKMGTYGELAEHAARTWERASGDFKESIVMQLGDATRRLTELGTDSAMAMSKAIDASGVGDKVNAWVGAFAEAWQTQKLADFLALSVEAAFEALGDTLRGTFHGLFAALGTDWWKHAFLGVVGLGQALAKTLTEAVTWAAQPIAAFATWASDQLRVAFVTAWDGFRQSAAGAVNWVIEAFEKVESALKRALSALPLPVSPVPSHYRRVDFGGGEAVREAETWQAAMENAGRARTKMLDDVGAWFVTARDDAKALLGLERASLDTQGKRVSAIDRLNEAWARFRKQNGPAVVALPKVGPADAGTAFDLERTEATLKRQLLDIERERARLEGDFRTTEAEKFRAREGGLAREQAALTEILRTLRERVAIETDPAVAEAMRARIDAHEREAFARERSLQSLGPDPSSWSDQFSASLTDLRNQFGTFQQSVARGFRSVVGGAVDSIASGIKGLIAQTMTWADALQNIAGGILNSVIDAISRMFAEWIVGRLLASNVAKAASVEEGATDAAAKAPGALFSSISSWGVAAVIGIGAVIAGLAALSGAFAEGGRPPVGRPALVGELGPEIFVPDRPGTILPNTMLDRNFSGGPDLPQEKPVVSNAVNVAMFDSRLDARKWAQSQEAEVWFVDMARRTSNRWRPS